MNRKTRAEERIEALDTSPEALAAAQVEAVRTERDEAVAKAEAERDEYRNALQRERAEFVNFRRRTTDERQQERGLAGVDLITKVLALADDFDRAIETRPADLLDDAWAEGIAAIDRKLRLLLESEGVTAVEAAPGTPFDPREHEAIVSVPGTGRAEGEIVEEVRRGYRLRDRLIRPALVAVAAAADPVPDPADLGAPASPGPGLVN
jgi:molecular chaperone GrpE